MNKVRFELFHGNANPSGELIQWISQWWYHAAGIPVRTGVMDTGEKWLFAGWLYSNEEIEELINRFQAKGAEILHKTDGEFILAVKSRSGDTVEVYRDRFGILPIVYGKGYDCLSISLWPNDVMDKTGIDPKPSSALLSQWLVFRGVLCPNAHIENISCFSGRCFLRISSGEITQIQIPFSPQVKSMFNTLDEAGRELGECFSRSVNRRISGRRKLTAWLSGGNDSSLLVAVARQHFSGEIETIFVSFEDYDRNYCNDAAYVSKKFDTVHREIVLTRKDYANLISETISAIQSPINHPGTIGQTASLVDQGEFNEMILSGKGADTVFGGPLWAPMIFLSYLGKFLHPTIREKIDRLSKKIESKSFLGKASSKMLKALGTPLNSYLVLGHTFGNEDDVDSVGGTGIWRNAVREWERYLRPNGFLNELFYFDMMDWHPANYDAEKRLCFHYGVVPCYPFLDYELISNSLRLPPYLRYNYKTKKASLKKYALNFFDHDFIYKPKEGFGVPLGRWFSSPEFEPFLMLPLEERSLRRRLWNERHLRRIIEDHRSGFGSDESAESVPWNMINIELWMRICLEGDSPSLYKVS